MRSAAFGLLAASVALACGNLDRDVIVEKPNTDGDVANDAGGATHEPDAAPPPREPIGCPRDGGCEPVRCAPWECSRYCPFGCGGTLPTNSATGPHPTTRSRPRSIP